MEGVDTVPYFWVFVAAAAVALLVEVLVLRTAVRRLRAQRELGSRAAAGRWEAVVPPAIPSRAPELLAALAPLVVVGTLVAALQESRHLMLRVLAPEVDPSEKAAMLARGISGTLNGVAFGCLPVMLVLGLGGAAAAMAVAARLRARGLARAVALAPAAPDAAAVCARHPGPEPGTLVATVLGFLCLGLGPILRAALVATAARVRFFGEIAGIDPSLKGPLLLRHLDESAAQMKEGLLQARIGLLAAVILAVALVIARSPVRARVRALGRAGEPPGAGAIALGLVFLVLAGAAFAAARPYQRENDTPWPAVNTRDLQLGVEADTPQLEGPDPVERAPMVVVTPAQLALDGRSVELAELGQDLDTLHTNYGLLHPGGLFNKQVLIACAPGTPRARLLPVLTTARQVDYEHPRLIFVRREVTERPLLGRRERTLATGAAFDLVTARDQAEEGSVFVESFAGCADLATRLVELRRAGKTVAVVVPR